LAKRRPIAAAIARRVRLMRRRVVLRAMTMIAHRRRVRLIPGRRLNHRIFSCQAGLDLRVCQTDLHDRPIFNRPGGEAAVALAVDMAAMLMEAAATDLGGSAACRIQA